MWWLQIGSQQYTQQALFLLASQRHHLSLEWNLQRQLATTELNVIKLNIVALLLNAQIEAEGNILEISTMECLGLKNVFFYLLYLVSHP